MGHLNLAYAARSNCACDIMPGAEFVWPEGVWLSKSLPTEGRADYSCFRVSDDGIGGESD